MKNYIIKLLFLIAGFSFMGCNSVQRLYITYGTFKDIKPVYETYRIFFDRSGNIYPDYTIDDTLLRSSNSQLGEYYKNDSAAYHAICKLYNIKPNNISNQTVTNSPLQEAIISKKAAELNASDKELFFIIHGYNDHPSKPNGDSSSDGMKKTREWIENQYPNRFLFVEVYWDGLSRKNGTKISIFNAFHIWNNAQASASNTGFELRRLFSKLNKKKNYVLTHSLGASVITTALFNVEKLNNTSQIDDLKLKFKDKVYNTPSHEFHVGMIAPAIPGENTFDEYYFRTVNGKNTLTNDSNYFFTVGFNRYDPVTTKGYALSKIFGSTTLACKRTELEKTLRLFENNPSVIDYEDFSYREYIKKQRSHNWLVYIKNNFHFKNFAKKLTK